MINWHATVKGEQEPIATAGVMTNAGKKSRVRLKLTANGRKLVKARKSVKITTDATFTPTGGTANPLDQAFHCQRLRMVMRTTGGWGRVLGRTARALVTVGCKGFAVVVVLAGVFVFSAAAQAASVGRLRVVVSGLPAGQHADVVVVGPDGFRRPASGPVTLGVRPGRYRLLVREVRISQGTARIPAGSLAIPASGAVRGLVRVGRTVTLSAVYGTIRSARFHELTGGIAGRTGSSLSPSSIKLSGSSSIAVGEIISRAPSPEFPAGLFARVTAVTHRAGRTVIKLVPASLQQAFPELSITGSIGLQPAPHLTRLLKTPWVDGFSPLQFGLTPGDFGCDAPLTSGYSFSASDSLSASAVVDLHFPLFGQPHGQVSVSLDGSQSLGFGLPAGLGCEATVPLPALYGYIFGIPVYIQVAATGSASIVTDWHGTVSGSLSLTAGISFKGSHITPLFTVHPSIKATSTGDGQISIGPQLELGIGAADLANVHLDLSPQDMFTAGSGGCTLAIVDELTAGIKFWPFSLNEPKTLATHPLYTCPTGHGGGGATVTVTDPGNQTGTVGTPVNLQIQARDSDDGTLTYSASGLPDGLSINPTTGLITGTPASASTASVTVTAADASGQSDTATFTWSVLAPLAPTPSIYYQDLGTAGDYIVSAALDGSSAQPSTIGGPTSGVYGPVISGPYIYWQDHDSDDTWSIDRATLDGSDYTPSLITDPNGEWSLATDGSHIYWLDWNQTTGAWSVARANLDGSSVEPDYIPDIAYGSNGVYGLAVNSSYIYWRAYDVLTSSFEIVRANLDGSSPTAIVTGLQSDDFGLAVQGTYIYWTDENSTADVSTISRANLDGSNPTTLITIPWSSGDIRDGFTVDSSNIYWVADDRALAAARTVVVSRANLDGSSVDTDFITDGHVVASTGLAVAGG